MNIVSTFKEMSYTLLKKYTPFNDIMTVKAYAKTPFAEQLIVCAIYNSGDIENVTIMNRDANNVYTLQVESRTLTTPHILQKKIAKALRKTYDDAYNTKSRSSHYSKNVNAGRWLLIKSCLS